MTLPGLRPRILHQQRCVGVGRVAEGMYSNRRRPMLVQESCVNATEGYRRSDSEVYDAWCDTPGELFRECQKDHGRCTGKVYIDLADDEVQQIGWVFQKRRQYTDCNETYLAETWVTVHTTKPERSIAYHYADPGRGI